MRRTFALFYITFVFTLWLPAGAWAVTGDFGRQFLEETNVARTQPHRYAEYLRELRGGFIGKGYRVPGSFNLVMTQEGVAAVEEAIDFLSRQRPVPALYWSPGLARAAAELVKEQAASGATGHDGERSGSFRQRIERQGNWDTAIAENIGYGPDTARRMVMDLIIDDGVPGRGHRKNIFNPSFAIAGAACGPHPIFRKMCVMEFAAKFKSK